MFRSDARDRVVVMRQATARSLAATEVAAACAAIEGLGRSGDVAPSAELVSTVEAGLDRIG